MSQYFGFKPSSDLSNLIDEADALISTGKDVPYYPYRDKIAHQIAREIIDNLLISLIDVIPSPDRQASMRKIVTSIENSTDTMLNILLNKDKNKDVLPTFAFMKESIFEDNDGNRRIGFKLTEKAADKIITGFEAVTEDSVDMEKFKLGLEIMNHEVLTHFITNFADTLKLGIFKRNAVPVAKIAIDKGLNMAINKLFPQLPDDALNRLVTFYRPYIVQIDE